MDEFPPFDHKKLPKKWFLYLDMSDMYLLSLASVGCLGSEISKELKLTQAAITQRFYKISDAVGIVLRQKHHDVNMPQAKILTYEGLQFARHVREYFEGLTGIDVTKNLPLRLVRNTPDMVECNKEQTAQ